MATIIVLIAILTAIFGRQSMQMVESFARTRLVNAANAAVSVATADELSRIQTREDLYTTYAKSIKQRMVEFAKANDVLWIYYVRRGQDGLYYYIMDNDMNPDTSVEPEMDFTNDSASVQAFQGITAATQFGEYTNIDELLDIAAIANPDHTEYYLSGYAPIYDSNGEILYIVGVDILSDNLINHNKAMMLVMIVQIISAIFVLITGTVSTRMYRKRVAESMSASKAKSSFLSNMSHEMRTPMNTVIGMTQLALQNTNLEKKDEYLVKIRTASDHLLGVINDVLDMSKIDADKMTLAHNAFCLREVIERVGIVVSQAVEAKNQHYNISIDEAIPEWLVGDEQRFTQVITNIVSNAIKFTPDGGEISLRAIFGDNNPEIGCRIYIKISDTGIGISEDQQKNLFQAFEQADKDISRRFGGTGLGLALSKRIIEMMGGHINIQSKLGQGSTFLLDCQFGVLNSAPIPKPTEEKTAKVQDYSGQIVLLAEDIEINREIVREVLIPTGITVLEAENGEQAIAMFEKNQVDLILMDIQMPVIDGYEATRRIRQMPYKNATTVPIIAMTANVFQEDINLCMEAGMNEHIGKPIDFAQLLAVMKKYLKSNEE
ncbi:MAG: response regulator [Clostridium sp.]|nr:response regulator [Clostridium sp.]